MGRKIIRALVKPELLIWAREYAYLSQEEAARKLGIKQERLAEWEQGAKLPTVIQLRKAARVYHQSLAVFYLPKPPDKKRPILKDFRRLPSEKMKSISPELAYEIRVAAERREIVLELYKEIGEEPPLFSPTASVLDNPSAVGLTIRKQLGVDFEEQSSWRQSRIAFNRWREILDNVGVLVFQATSVGLQETRGFSICEFPLPVLIVNRKDSPSGRIFTMAHEMSHIALRGSGLCDLSEPDPSLPPEEQAVEVFCNKVAAEILVPAEIFFRQDIVDFHHKEYEWSDWEIKKLAKRFGVSREVIVRRLLTFGLVTKQFYLNKREQYQKEYRKEGRRSGFLPPARNIVSEAGKPYIRTVLEAHNLGKITTSDVSAYLGVRIKHLEKIQESIGMG